jgi:hypothetical protein
MKTILGVILLVTYASSLLTSSKFKKEGIDIHNSFIHTIKKV